MSGEELVARVERERHPGFACWDLTQMEPTKCESLPTMIGVIAPVVDRIECSRA